jgi:HEAT repeat protein
MKKLLITAGLLALGALCLQDITSGHGGTYRGPGDTVPPGGGGGTGGGPGTPGTGGPSTPGPSGPSTPGPAAPGTPGGAGPKAATTTGGGPDTGPDLTVWQYWWGFNKEPYLNLKAHIHAGAVGTSSDDFYLGHGEKTQARDTLRPSEEVIRGKVVPALLDALKNERSNHIISGCLIALAKIGDAKDETGDSAFAGEIRKFLADGNQEIRETAALALGILANEAPNNLDILFSLLNNDSARLRSEHKVQITGNVDDRQRAFAAFGLGLVGAKASDDNRRLIVQNLVRMLDGESRSMGTRDVAVGCVTALGMIPLPIDASASSEVDIKKGWPRPSEIKSRQDELLWLMSYYDEGDQKLNHLVRAHCPQAVARLLAEMPGDYWMRRSVAARFLEDIKKLSKEKDEVKQSCIIALGQIGDCDADDVDRDIRNGLMAVKDELSDQMARNFALIALAQCAGRPGAGQGDPLAGLNDPKDKKASPRSFLLNELAKGKSGAKPWAALALGVMERSLVDNKFSPASESKGALQQELKDAKSPIEIGAYAIALGIAQASDAQEALRDKLETIGDLEARGYLAVAIGLIDDRSAIERLQELIRKSKYNADLLKSAAIGLGLLGDKQIVPELISMLNEASGLSSQAAISSALGFIGDSRSIDPLIALLQDKQKTDNARGFAAVALGIVADKEDLPWNTKISVNINYRANTKTLTAPTEGTGILDIL